MDDVGTDPEADHATAMQRAGTTAQGHHLGLAPETHVGAVRTEVGELEIAAVPLDAGVHARQQFVHLDLPCTVVADGLHYQLNAVLPPDIAVVAMRLVKPTVHARFDALARTYEYTILRCKSPFQHETSCLLRGELDVRKMNEAAAILCRKRDFKGLCKVRVDDDHFLCDIMEASWSVQEEQLVFRIKANRFLRSMVRVIVSLLLKIGQGKLSLLAFEALIDQRERDLAVSLVPARGLTLTQVIYPENIFLS